MPNNNKNRRRLLRSMEENDDRHCRKGRVAKAPETRKEQYFLFSAVECDAMSIAVVFAFRPHPYLRHH
jgi:hypothetical protein